MGYHYLICLSLCFAACQPTAVDKNLLVKAYDSKLYMEDLEHLLVNVDTKIDSQLVIEKAIDNWLLNEILFEEAKKEIADKSKIKKLQEDYKKSLFVHELEKQKLSELVDRPIAQSELDTFYSQHESQFLLNDPLVKFLFIKIPESDHNDDLKSLWKTEDLPALRNFINDSKERNGILDIEKWYEFSMLKNIIPDDLYKKINLNKTEGYTLIEDNQYFLIKILGSADKGDKMPKSFAFPIIKERLLRDRSNMFVTKWKKELYQNNIQSKDIVIIDQSSTHNNN